MTAWASPARSCGYREARARIEYVPGTPIQKANPQAAMARTNTIELCTVPMAMAAAAQTASHMPGAPLGPLHRALGMEATALAL